LGSSSAQKQLWPLRLLPRHSWPIVLHSNARIGAHLVNSRVQYGPLVDLLLTAVTRSMHSEFFALKQLGAILQGCEVVEAVARQGAA
jgi:hypothetical protein